MFVKSSCIIVFDNSDKKAPQEMDGSLQRPICAPAWNLSSGTQQSVKIPHTSSTKFCQLFFAGV